jgi:hypothetical protein
VQGLRKAKPSRVIVIFCQESEAKIYFLAKNIFRQKNSAIGANVALGSTLSESKEIFSKIEKKFFKNLKNFEKFFSQKNGAIGANVALGPILNESKKIL